MSTMKSKLVAAMLAILNSRWLNQSPCSYAYVGNVDAFDAEYLRSEERQRPGITVATILEEAARFKCCSLKTGLTVIEGDDVREGTIWDIHELRQGLSRNDSEATR